jgi:hypothetical protein
VESLCRDRELETHNQIEAEYITVAKTNNGHTNRGEDGNGLRR